jgi:hypothetical protein
MRQPNEFAGLRIKAFSRAVRNRDVFEDVGVGRISGTGGAE